VNAGDQGQGKAGSLLADEGGDNGICKSEGSKEKKSKGDSGRCGWRSSFAKAAFNPVMQFIKKEKADPSYHSNSSSRGRGIDTHIILAGQDVKGLGSSLTGDRKESVGRENGTAGGFSGELLEKPQELVYFISHSVH